MACYYCEECGQLKDGDWVNCMEWGDDLICEDCHTELTPENYEEWTVSYWQKPIPIRTMDWEITHNDYDPTPLHSGGPPGDDRFFTGPSLRDVWEQARDYEDD